jgi:hypothetical protein
LIDEIISDEFASPDLELAWLDEDDGDPETVLEGRLKVGALTLNEMRDALGLDPYDNAAADRPMVLTATGFVPIEANANAGGEGGSTRTQKTLAAKAREIGLLRSDSLDEHFANDLSTMLRKYGYDPAELRVPKHNVGGGEWTRTAVDDDPNETSDGPPFPRQRFGKGHHWVPRTVFNKKNLKPETWDVFENTRSGTLANPRVNINNAEHIEYNEAVDELFEDYLKKNKIASEQMTPEQARELIEEVKESSDPRIRGLVMKIQREVLRYIRIYGPRGMRGGRGGDPD